MRDGAGSSRQLVQHARIRPPQGLVERVEREVPVSRSKRGAAQRLLVARWVESREIAV